MNMIEINHYVGIYNRMLAQTQEIVVALKTDASRLAERHK